METGDGDDDDLYGDLGGFAGATEEVHSEDEDAAAADTPAAATHDAAATGCTLSADVAKLPYYLQDVSVERLSSFSRIAKGSSWSSLFLENIGNFRNLINSKS